jgi:hypothetical protein
VPFENELRDLLNLTSTDAGGADTEPAAGAVDQSANGLQVEIPTPLGHVVSVADAVSELGAAATDFANFRHKTGFSRRSKETIITIRTDSRQPALFGTLFA